MEDSFYINLELPTTGQTINWELKRKEITMSSMYDCTRCPLCGELMWNGQCENLDCKYHWYPKDDDDEGEDYQGYIII